MRVCWSAEAWAQYTGWQDRAALRRIHVLIEDILRNGYQGIGKPEALRADMAGWHSRRIDREHRLIYRIMGDDLEIIQCRYHYSDTS
jgi:toxin YoeB